VFCDPTPGGWCDPGFAVDAAAQGIGIFGLGINEVHPGNAGTWTQGAYFQGAAVLRSEIGNGLWLSYLPQEKPQTASAPVSPAAVPSTSPTPEPSPPPAPAVGTIGLPNTSSGAGSGWPLTVVGVAGLLLAWRRRPRRDMREAVLQE
jgi:MYXO-CTERM domain-containing protein